jgi:Ca2+-binding EF-hand superfamily protein
MQKIESGASAPAQAPTTVKPTSDVAFGAKVPLEKIYPAFFGQESAFGKADTTKFNEYRVIGPMQIKKETFEGYQKQGIIPKEYRIDNPEENLKAGKLILEDLHKKYDGDIEKIAAAYYGGPKVINKDGTINLNVKPIRTNPATGKPYDENDPKRPKDPTVGEYIDQIKKRIEGEPVVKPVSNRPKTILELQREGELKAERAKLTMQNDVKKVDEFERTTDINELSRHRAVANKAMKILSKNPSVAGTLRNDTGAIAAIQQFIAGSMKRVDFEDIMNTALAKTVADSNERRELIGYLAENEIRNRGMVKGTGAISDYEQQILSRIAGNISDPAEVLYKRFRVFDKTNEYNIAIRKLWNKNKKQFGSLSEFEDSKDYQELLTAYQKDLDNVIYEESDFSAARKERAASNKGGSSNPNRPPEINAIIKRNEANK